MIGKMVSLLKGQINMSTTQTQLPENITLRNMSPRIMHEQCFIWAWHSGKFGDVLHELILSKEGNFFYVRHDVDDPDHYPVIRDRFKTQVLSEAIKQLRKWGRRIKK